MATKKAPVNGWNLNWLQKNAPAGVTLPGGAIATGPGTATPTAAAAPPIGTYDPSIDYNAGAANRGLLDTQDDAATQYEQGQEDYGTALSQLGVTHQNTLADLLTGKTRSDQDYGTATSDLGHQYTVLGHQQAENAAQSGITSAGLLGQSATTRAANQTHDQTALDVTHNRALADYATNVDREDTGYTDATNQLGLQNARQFGGYGGSSLTDPYTGKPVFGTLATSLARAGQENDAYQYGLGQQRIQGAQANSYVAPTQYTFTPPAAARSTKRVTYTTGATTP